MTEAEMLPSLMRLSHESSLVVVGLTEEQCEIRLSGAGLGHDR